MRRRGGARSTTERRRGRCPRRRNARRVFSPGQASTGRGGVGGGRGRRRGRGGWRWRQSRLMGQLGLYAPRVAGIPSTTRQAEVLCTAISAPPTNVEGLLNGIDLTTGQPVYHDPFTAYEQKVVSSPNVVVLGDLG